MNDELEDRLDAVEDAAGATDPFGDVYVSWEDTGEDPPPDAIVIDFTEVDT